MGSGGRRVVSRGGRRRSLAETDRPPRVGAPSGGSTAGLWTGGSGSKSSGGGAGRPLLRSYSPTLSARLSVPTRSEGAATAAAAASEAAGGRSRRDSVDCGGGAGEALTSTPSPPRESSSAASGLSTSLSSVIPGVLQSTDLDVYGRGDDAVFGPGAAAATQYEAAAALEATRRRTSVVGAGEHVDRDGWGRGDSIIFGRGASTIAARDAAAAHRRVQRRSARRGYIVPAATLIEGRWRRELRPGRWIGSRPDSAATAVGGSPGRASGRSATDDASSAASTSLRAGVSRSSGNVVASGGTRTSLDMGGDDHFIPVNAGGAYLDRTDEPRSLSRGISSTGSTLAFPAAEEPSVGGVDEPATADLFDSDDMALLASYGRRRGGASEGGSSGALWGTGGRRASGSTEEPSTSELLRDETGLEAAAAVAAREAAAARGEEYDEGIIVSNRRNRSTAGIASRTSPVVAEGGAYGVRIYLDGGADSDSDSSSGVDPPVGGGTREYSPEVEALLFGDDSENDGDVEETAQGGRDGASCGGAANGSTFQGATGSGGGTRRRSSAADNDASDMIYDDVGEDNWPLVDGGQIYAGTTEEYETEGSRLGLTADVGASDESAGDTAGIVRGGQHAGASDGTSPSSRGRAASETATVVAAAATAVAAAAAASTASAVGTSPDGWGSEADDAPSSSARFASASTDLSVPGAGVMADGESDADALRAPEEEQDGEEVREGGWSPLAAVPSAGNDGTHDGAADPAAFSTSSLGDNLTTNVWPGTGDATREALSPPLEASTSAGERNPPLALAAAAAAAEPPPAPLASSMPEPLLETPSCDRTATAGAADGDKPASPLTVPPLVAAVPAADGDAPGAPPGSILAAPPGEQPPMATLDDDDSEVDDAPAEQTPSRLAAAATTVGSKATVGVAAAVSALATVASIATGRGGEPSTETDAEVSHKDAGLVDSEAGDDPAQAPPSRLSAAASTVGSKAAAGVVAAGSTLAAVAGMATGRGGEPTTEASEEEASSDAPRTTSAAVAGGDPAYGTTDTALSDVGEAPGAAHPAEGALPAPLTGQADVESKPATAPLVERANDSSPEPADEPASQPFTQPAAQPAGGLPTADPAVGPAAGDSTATPAVDHAAEPDVVPVTVAAADAAAAPVAAPAAAALRPAEIPSATRSASAPPPIDAAAADEAAAGARPVAANDGGNRSVALPADAVKVAAAAAVLPASADLLVDAPSEAGDDDYEPADADVASDDDFTAEGPSTGSWAGITAPTFSAVTPASAIPTTAVGAAAGSASAVAATADPASATEPDEADDYTTVIDGWEDSLVLTRGGGGSRGCRLVHFGREPASNATSATDDDARYYDARLELP